MRPEGEVPSDFQEYTLVALLGVAVTLANTNANANAVLENLVGGGNTSSLRNCVCQTS